MEDNYIDPDWEHSALITIDMQNDFSLPGSPAEIKGTHEIIPKIKMVLNVCRQYQVPIIHVIRIYKRDGSNVDICRRGIIESGKGIVTPYSGGAELVAELKPNNAVKIDFNKLLRNEFQELEKNEWIMYKSRWGAFYKTSLEEYLRRKNINTLIFAGCNFPNCPRTSIYEASERDFKTVMIEDAVSGVYVKGVDELRNIGVKIINSQQLVENIITKISR